MALAVLGSKWTRWGRGSGLLALALSAYGAGAGCSGKTSHTDAPGDSRAGSGGRAGTGGKVGSGGMAHAGSTSKPVGGAGGVAPSPSSGDAGASGASETSDAGSGGALGGSGGSGGGGSGGTHCVDETCGWAGMGGYSNGKLMCYDGVCGYQCEKDGVIGEPGWDFYVECNKCHCNYDGRPDCEQKDCTKDCDWFANEYQAAYGEAQYCMLDTNVIDPCLRVQTSSLPCPCAAPVSSVKEFQAISKNWELKWQAAGCKKPPGMVCPPCNAGSAPHCDTEMGICVYTQ